MTRGRLSLLRNAPRERRSTLARAIRLCSSLVLVIVLVLVIDPDPDSDTDFDKALPHLHHQLRVLRALRALRV